MRFAHAPDCEYAPYLLDFTGTPAERHVENLKACSSLCPHPEMRILTTRSAQILREVGPIIYSRAVALTCGPDAAWFTPAVREIQRHFIGPDCYWRDPARENVPGCTSHFGHSWWVPFPPSIVRRHLGLVAQVLTNT
jgi:hypothetical protein